MFMWACVCMHVHMRMRMRLSRTTPLPPRVPGYTRQSAARPHRFPRLLRCLRYHVCVVPVASLPVSPVPLLSSTHSGHPSLPTRVHVDTASTHHARLPLGRVQGRRSCPHAKPGWPTHMPPPAPARQLHYLLSRLGLLRPGADCPNDAAVTRPQELIRRKRMIEREAKDRELYVHPPEPSSALPSPVAGLPRGSCLARVRSSCTAAWASNEVEEARRLSFGHVRSLAMEAMRAHSASKAVRLETAVSEKCWSV